MKRFSRWLSVLAIVVAVAQGAPAQTDAEEAYLEAQAKQAELLRELANLARAEEEQKALRRELARTDDELAKERQRADELQRELERLTGKPAAVTAEGQDAAAPSPAGRRMLAIPERRTNALGILAQEPIAVGAAPEGATTLRLIPLEPHLPTELAVHEHEGRLVFGKATALETSVPLAELALRDGQLWWSWQVGSPLPVETALTELDRVLATAEVHALAGTTVVAQYQAAPLQHRVSLGERNIGVPLPKLSHLPLSLEVAGDAPGWTTDQRSPTVLHVASREAAAAIEWRAGEAVLSIRRGLGLTDAIAQAKRELDGWDADLRKLQTAATRDEAEIVRVQSELAKAQEKHRQLEEMEARVGPDSRQIEVRLTAPNGVVCSRITLTVD